MSNDKLNLEETKDMFIFVSQKMVENKDVLTQADKAIGDGDHGVGMARGFEAVTSKLKDSNFMNIGELLNLIGTTLLTSIGGAAGAIFGVFFRDAGQNLKDKDYFNSIVFSQMLNDGLKSVKERGKAKAGDKTMVDALEPATLKANEMSSSSLSDFCQVISDAAKEGKEKTKDMIAKIGKAKTLGERSIGHPDPGAISIYLILKFISEYIDTH
jgi:dihydroxyacetone kinase-like protein